jgi:LuxR family maltose regulon positive regulatory protein
MSTQESAPAEPTTGTRHSSGLVARSRLISLLDEGVAGSVTLVSAPPGSGKSTLVRSWLAARQSQTAAAWVDVTRDETDEAHFWGQVLDAIRDAGVVPADSALATLVPTPHAQPGELVGHVLAGLRQLEEPLVLVLDDVQHLRSAELVSDLETLVTEAPPQLRVVLLSRRDP